MTVDEQDRKPRPPGEGATHRLGYLLKHAELQYAQLTSAELAPLGIGPREWAALSCLEEQPGRSQREVAGLLGVDRTTMVALLDDLQKKGLVRRRPQPGDRRKNIVVPTRQGRELRQRGARLLDDCERRFLALLTETAAAQLKDALAVVTAAGRRTAQGGQAATAGHRPVTPRASSQDAGSSPADQPGTQARREAR